MRVAAVALCGAVPSPGRPVTAVLQRQGEFVGVLLQLGMARLACRLAELGVLLRVREKSTADNLI